MKYGQACLGRSAGDPRCGGHRPPSPAPACALLKALDRAEVFYKVEPVLVRGPPDESDTILEHQVAVRARTRPIRVCYMLEDNVDASEILTEIFAECYARWRGVYTLIVPVVAGKIDDRYLASLRSFDPDVLYSYCDLSEELVTHVDRLCMPAILQRHRDKEIGGRGNSSGQVGPCSILNRYTVSPCSQR